MSYRAAALLVLFAIFASTTAFHTCRCEDYGSMNGCHNFGGCFWDATQQTCMDRQTNCTNLTEDLCTAPGCVYANNQCMKFQNCNSITGDVTTCRAYGCVLGANNMCTDFEECHKISDPVLCTGFVDKRQNEDQVCYWNMVANQCVGFTGCKGADLDICKLAPMCRIDGQTCKELDCGAIKTIANCQTARPFCMWNAEGKAECRKNDCSKFNAESNCLNDQNRDYCSWDGKGCKQCFDFGANGYFLYGFMAVLSLLILL